MFQSRITVFGAISSTSAISSLLNPPKNLSSTTRPRRGSNFASSQSASSSAISQGFLLAIDKRKDLVSGRLVPAAPVEQQLGKLVCGRDNRCPISPVHSALESS